jgi:short-subunit dehydrogenase
MGSLRAGAPGPRGEPRVAVVTGGGTGIGAALARRLAKVGWKCILLGRREEPLRTLAEEIDGEHEVCDVADREAVEKVAAAVRERHPAVGLLVNNAGIAGRGNFLDLEPARIEQLVRINYLGTLWATRAFLPTLEAARGAQIVNVVSVAGTVAVGPYSASKHAQLALSRSLAAELRPRGIRVLTVNPGFVHTEGFPQDRLLGGRFASLVAGPELVADRIIRALGRRRAEIFVPGWYRPAAWAQAIAPSALARLRARRRR